MNKLIKRIAAAALASAFTTPFAAVTPQEAAQLGATLTPLGAEVKGNKDGSIPDYKGGLRTPPADFKPGSGYYPDPFRDEKPLYTVTSKNMDQHADKLTEGQKLLLTRYPDFRMDIYPTHRTAAVPKGIAEETFKNATRTSTAHEGVGITGAEGGLPFPIPKTGYEVMWNHLLTYVVADTACANTLSYYVDNSGRRVLTGYAQTRYLWPYYWPEHPDKDKRYFDNQSNGRAPAALNGQAFLIRDPIDYATSDRRAWQYIPGQRRVKVAPELAYDTPFPGGAGLQTMDDLGVFNGRMDRFSFKLVGKKEVFMPYNLYKLYLAHQQAPQEKAMELLGTAKFMNPDLMRWELRRVWVVEAELHPGKRHIYKKRVFYIDEDTYGPAMSDQYDSADKLLRFGYNLSIQLYEQDGMYSPPFVHYDFSSNVYSVASMPNGPLLTGDKGPPNSCRTIGPNGLSPDGLGTRPIM